ncbi:hypothetical protein FtMidnight_43 [Enterobacteria phage FtMidnight]
MNHIEISGLTMFKDPDTGNTIATGSVPTTVAFGSRIAPLPELENLLIAAPYLYNALTHQFNSLQVILDNLEKSAVQSEELEAFRNGLIQMQNGVLLAQRVAQIGIDEVAKSLDKP